MFKIILKKITALHKKKFVRFNLDASKYKNFASYTVKKAEILVEFEMFLSKKNHDVQVLAQAASQDGNEMFSNLMEWREITLVSDNSLEKIRKQQVRVFRFTYDVYDFAHRLLHNTVRNTTLKKQKKILRLRDLNISTLRLKVKCEKNGLHVSCARKGLVVRSHPFLLLTTYFEEDN